MKAHLGLVTSICIVAVANHSGAQYTQTRTVYQTVHVGPPEHLAAGDQYYDASFGGFRTYLESIRHRQPEIYAAVDPSLSALETRQTAGWAVFIGGNLLGLALILYPLTNDFGCSDAGLYEDCDSDFTLIYVGVGVGITSTLVGFLLRPGRSAMLDLVNEHNARAPATPIRIQMGYRRASGTALAALSIDSPF